MSEIEILDPPVTPAVHEECQNGSCSSNGGIDTSHTAAADASEIPADDAAADARHQESMEMLGKLPPEIGMLLIISGIAGVLLPGPVGMPLLIAGGVTMWLKTFEPIERWFSRKFPVVHREGVFQIKEFITDLQKRFPDQA